VGDLRVQCPSILPRTRSLDPDHLIHFLAVQDMTHGMARPCLADIKMGKQQFAPGAHNQESKAKKSKETTSGALGFRLCGTKAFDPATGDYRRQDKADCRLHTKWEVQAQLAAFVSASGRVRHDVLTPILTKLLRLRALMELQTEWLFYTSSLILLYDGSPGLADPAANVVLVDFAHTIPAHGDVDLNFLEGLNHLIEVLQCIASHTVYNPPPSP